jgi:hypothetical protein
MEKKRNALEVWYESLNDGDHMDDINVDEGIILK